MLLRVALIVKQSFKLNWIKLKKKKKYDKTTNNLKWVEGKENYYTDTYLHIGTNPYTYYPSTHRHTKLKNAKQ